MYIDNKEKKIFMKYPKIEGKDLYDGLEHSIIPREIYSFEFNNEEFYELEYFDESVNGRCSTILRKEGTTFYKVPLYNYANFNEICAGAKKRSLDILNNIEYIPTKEPVRSLDELVNLNNNYTFSTENVDYSEIFDRTKKPIKEITRESMLEDALYRITRATKWRYGELSLPEYNTIISMLDMVRLNSLSFADYTRFIGELKQGLDDCVETSNGAINYGNANINFERAIEFVVNLIKRYFRYEKENINVLLAASENRWPPNPDNPNNPTKFFVKLDGYLIEKYKEELKQYITITGLPTIRFNVALYKDSYTVFDFLPQYYRTLNKYEYSKNNAIFHEILKYYIEHSKKMGFEKITKKIVDINPNLKEYLDKNGFCAFYHFDFVQFTLDLDTGCCYYGINKKVKNGVVFEYNLALYKDKEMFDAINTSLDDIRIQVPEGSEYLEKPIDKRAIKMIFRKGIIGDYTLSTAGYISEGKENKQPMNLDDDLSMSGMKK